MAQIIDFPLENKVLDKEKLIDALLDIRLTLCVKKINSNVITRKELREILDDKKKMVDDGLVKSSIDDLFDEYFVNKDSVSKNENDSLSIAQMEEMLNDNIKYEQSDSAMGTSFVKRDNHFNSKPQETDNKVA